MRTLGRMLVIGVVLLSAYQAGTRIWESLDWGYLANLSDERIKAAKPGSAYELAAAPWLDFRIDKQASAILVRSNGIVTEAAAADPDAVWTYAFDYELIGAQNDTVEQGRYYHRTRSTRFRDPATGAEQPRSFVLDPGLLPTDSRSMLADFESRGPIERLRLRPAKLDPALDTVAFRVYQHLPNPPQRIGYLWQRLSPVQRDRLARGSVYGPDLLRSEEKANLLRRTWKAVGPRGVNGEDYRSRKIYVARESVGEKIEPGLLPEGLYVDADTRGIIPLPEGHWRVNLRFERLGATSLADNSGAVTLRWYGRGLSKRWQTRLPISAADEPLEPHFDGGLLEVAADRPLVVRAWADSGESHMEVTPEPTRLPGYKAAPSAPLRFGVSHVGGQATPLRIDVRARIPRHTESLQAALEYALLAADGKPVDRGVLELELLPSAYDRLAKHEPEIMLSDPARFYFRLPPSITAIRLATSHELLISGYSRPPDLTRVIRVPEDYRTYEAEDERQPAWFLLQPLEAQRLRRELRSAGLLVQKRPPKTDPMLMAGVYAWESYRPEGNWRGRFLMLPYESAFPVRDQALGSVYRELPRNRRITVDLSGGIGRREVSPTLVFVREGDAPANIDLTVDGRSHLKTRIAGTQGEVRIPPLRPGRRQLQIQSSAPARFFLNYAGASGTSYLRRLAMRLDSRGLDFSYQKSGSAAELLTAEFYTRSSSRTQLQASITPAEVTSGVPGRDWTFTERLYDLDPADTEPVAVLNTRTETVDGGRRFWLPLGADLPAASYRIRIRPRNGADGYLVLYRLIPGQQVSRLFFRERPYAD